MVQHNPSQTTKGIWQKGFQCLSAVSLKTVYISFLTILLPQILFELLISRESTQVSKNIIDFSLSNASGLGVDVFALGPIVTPFLSTVVVAGLALAVLHLVGYYAVMMTADSFHKGELQKSLWTVLVDALVLVVKRGFLAVFIFWLVVLFAQVVLPPAIFIVAPGILIPAILVTQRCSLFKAVKQVVKLDFTKSFPGGKWALFFQLLSFGAFVYTGVLLLFYFRASMYSLDIWLGLTNSFLSNQIAGTPFNGFYILVVSIQLVLWSVLMAFVSTYSVSIYHWAKAFEKKLPKGGIVV